MTLTKTTSVRLHGLLDYLWSVLLIASPWLFGFADETVNRAIAACSERSRTSAKAVAA